MLSLFEKLFGNNKKIEYPFDVDKAYRYSRQGVISGGNFYLKFNGEKIVTYYSYVKPVPEDEGGMRDRGAQIYFVGLKEGTVEVTAVYEYPTCPAEEYNFTLKVAKDLSVSRVDN